MFFELSPEIVDQIIFAMENQSEQLRFDTETSRTVEESSLQPPIDEDRYVVTPDWDSFHGFQLMEQFVSTLRNPVYREALRNALSRGKGVFRHFKDVLKEKREIERLWYSFKDRDMKREVREWYESLLESWGCEDLEIDLEFLEETEDLIATDFVFDTAIDDIGIDRLKEYDRTAFFEGFQDYYEIWTKNQYERRIAQYPAMDGKDSLFYIARSPDGDFAGFIWAAGYAHQSLKLIQLYILPDFRGLGLAKTMFNKFMTEISMMSYRNVEFEVNGHGLFLSEYFEQQGFSVFSKSYMIDIKDWHPEGEFS